MKYKLLYVFAFLASIIVLGSCAEKEDNTPSLADKDRLETLIDADISKIADFRDKYGTYILYNFDKNLDFAYQFEQASSWSNATLSTITHDDAEVAVQMLYDNIFSCYEEGFIKKYFPRKLLLVSDITSPNELGLSNPLGGHHTAVANINSVTFAKMSANDIATALQDEALTTSRCNEMHRALLADYLVKARGEYPVDEDYLSLSMSTYSSLMNSSRKTVAQLLREDENFFYNHGFFIPQDEEATYFPNAEEDIVSFICNMITMDNETANAMLDMPLMASKMHLIATGLQQMGVDVLSINPHMEQFITMEYVHPAVMYAKDVVTDNPKATLELTILRGSHALSHLVVNINGKDAQTVDLSQYDKMRVVIPIELDGLVKGANAVTIKLYEEGRDRVAATLTTGVSYATLDEVIGFNIKRTDDHEEAYRSIKISRGNGGNMDNETNPDLITIALEKHGYMDRYFMEQEGEYHYWKMYKKGTHVETIVDYLQDGFNEDYTAPLYRIVKTYKFAYNADDELTEVTLTDENNITRPLVTDVVYIAGRITRYTYDGKIYDPSYATVNGITTRVDCLDKDMSGLKFGFDGTENLNPYFMPELPAVIPGEVSEIPLQIFYSQYLFNSLEGIWAGGWHRNLEDKVNYSEVTRDGITTTYRFKLK